MPGASAVIKQKGFKTGVLKPLEAVFSRRLVRADQSASSVKIWQGLVAAASTTAAATGAATASAAAAVGAAETAIATAATGAAATAAAGTTAVAAATTAAATTVAATTTAAAEAAAAWRTCLHGTGFVDDNATAAQRLTVHAGDCRLGFGIAAHFDKAKAFGATRVAFHHDFSAGDSAKLAKRLLQVFVTHRVWQVADV